MILARLNVDHGVHLSGTPLWLDADRKRDLCVLTSLHNQMPARHTRLVASASMARVLTRVGYRGDVLPLPWGRMIGLVGHEIALHDAGVGLGISSALIKQHGASMLYVGALRCQRARWPKAQCVIIDMPAFEHRGDRFERVMDQLCAIIASKTRHGDRIMISTGVVDAAYAIWQHLCAQGIGVDVTGFLHKIVGAERSAVASETDRGRRARCATQRPLVMLRLNCQTIDRAIGSVPDYWVHVDVGLQDDASLPHGHSNLDLPLAWFAGRRELRELIKHTGANKVVVMGIPPAKQPRLQRDFRGLAKLAFLYPAQQLVMAF